jgi:hypothetical protein
MTTYLKMLASSLEHNDTVWWMADDLWWSFLPTWSFLCLSYSWTSCLLYRTPFSFFCHVTFLFFLLWILALYLDLLLVELVVRWAGSLLALSFSLYHSDSCVFFFGVHWRCKLKFLLDCLTVWRRVVLLCLLAILMVKEGTSLELA